MQTKYKPDILKHINFSLVPSILIHNPTPAIESSGIREHQKQVSLIGGEVTPSQLYNFLQNSIGTFQFQNVDVVGDKSTDLIDSSSQLFVSHEKPGGVGKVMAGLPQFSSPVTVYVLSKVFEEDWPAIVKSKEKNCLVKMGQIDDFEIDTSQPLNHITLGIGSQFNIGNLQGEMPSSKLKLILKSDVRLQVYRNSFQSDDCLDLLFAVNGRYLYGLSDSHFAHLRNGDVKNLEQFAYGFNDKGELTDLYMPYGESASQIKRYRELRSLSFDGSWLLGFFAQFSRCRFRPSFDFDEIGSVVCLGLRDCQFGFVVLETVERT